MRAIMVGPLSSTTRGLPLLEQLLGLGKLLDIDRGILEGNDLATAGQGNGIVEGARPISHDAARMGQRRRRDDRTRCRASGRSLKPPDYYCSFAQFVFSFRSVLLRILRQFLRR